VLGDQLIRDLSKIHNHDFSAASIESFDIPAEGGQSAALLQMNWWERVWEEDFDIDVPLMRLAMGWLRTNVPDCEKNSIVHADFRMGNFLFDEASCKITAWLDWELCHIGDRHEDLAYTMNPMLGSVGEDGKTVLVSGLVPSGKFLDDYQEYANYAVDPKRLTFYNILCHYYIVVRCYATASRIVRNGKSHQGVTLTWISGLSYSVLEKLRKLMEKV
jgi:aminoglycoside phosphotransferase (APT) family kinase protein